MIERFFEFIAPDCCIVCNKEGVCICAECEANMLVTKKPSCVLCNSLTELGQICRRCRSKTRLSGVSVAYRYETVSRELIKRLKYHQQRSVAKFFAKRLIIPDHIHINIVSFVPSDGRAQRARGYNQAELLAKRLAKIHGLQLKPTLLRKKHSRQVDLSRAQRLEQIKGNFALKKSVSGQTVLLVDDVVTTGATLRECAEVLKSAGAKEVWATTVAKK